MEERKKRRGREREKRKKGEKEGNEGKEFMDQSPSRESTFHKLQVGRKRKREEEEEEKEEREREVKKRGKKSVPESNSFPCCKKRRKKIPSFLTWYTC